MRFEIRSRNLTTPSPGPPRLVNAPVRSILFPKVEKEVPANSPTRSPDHRITRSRDPSSCRHEPQDFLLELCCLTSARGGDKHRIIACHGANYFGQSWASSTAATECAFAG